MIHRSFFQLLARPVPSAWSRILLAAAFLFTSGVFFSGVATADGLATSAEYIIGFVRYVHWETEDKVDAWHICIVGDVPPEQDRLYANEIVRGKHFVVNRISADAALSECHVLDLSATDTATSNTIVKRSRHMPILSVGNGSLFCSEGGQVCLHFKGDDKKFEINLSAVRESGLSVSARLLMLGAGRTADKESQ